MLKFCCGIFLLLALALAPVTVTEAQVKVLPGSKIFVAPMDEDFNTLIATEMVKRKLPVAVVTDETAADFVLSGTVSKSNDKWYNSALGGKDQKEGSVRLLSVKDKQLVWVGEAGDKGTLWGSLSKSGQGKLAERLVAKMKKDLFGK
ncbi:MAG TPA: hypothetical protein PLD20_17315 [Blastocatellia bacterium]|nr:hypothetical protein [Blastocatellia bacterium]HMX29692.1 hypothetical protein [Blastocatellia bacterium]HMY75795.1 hypothetical protein [Blastocatellia bacterium]HMZ19699.1 hypothetical protein [Blastocatellia bacterium]HNG29523.1 hypothetical protein [Blastocatellia bacterium]